MSFSSDVKKELCSLQINPGDNLALERTVAECYGMLLFGKRFSFNDISLATESRSTAGKFVNFLTGLFSPPPIIDTIRSLKTKSHEIRLYTVRVVNSDDCLRIFEKFGHDKSQINLRINMANIDDDTVSDFLRGVFLSCGSVTDPAKTYHLEFIVSTKSLCSDLCRIIEDAGDYSIKPKVIQRSGVYVIYIKESSQIHEFLKLAGAKESLKKFEEEKNIKELRNSVNRLSNSEVANIKKTANAYLKHMKAIKIIQNSCGLESLPPELEELAKVRMENPELSLRGLGEMLTPPISRSGVNHRLEKIMEIAQSISGTGSADDKERE